MTVQYLQLVIGHLSEAVAIAQLGFDRPLSELLFWTEMVLSQLASAARCLLWIVRIS